MKIVYTNADQFTNTKKCELIELIEREEPHIVAINEVKPKNGAEQRDQDFAIEQFSIFTTNIDSTSGRGIVILVHSSISHLAIQVAPVVQFEEACLLEIKLEGSDVMLFGCIYRSPTQTSGSDENNNNLNALVHRLSDNKRYSHVCLTGDFNFHINWHQWSTPFSSRSKEELFLETLRNSFLYQHVLEPTRRRGTNEPSTLDLVLTSEENQVSDLTYHAPLGKSDHSVLSFNFNCYLNIKLTTKRFLYDKANYGAMKIAMDEDNWLQIFIRDADQLDVNDCWAMLKTKLHHLRNQYVPQSKVLGEARKGYQ